MRKIELMTFYHLIKLMELKMKISKTATSSELHKAPSAIYDNVLDGKVTRITNRSRKPMVLMTEADFLKLAKKVGN